MNGKSTYPCWGDGGLCFKSNEIFLALKAFVHFQRKINNFVEIWSEKKVKYSFLFVCKCNLYINYQWKLTFHSFNFTINVYDCFIIDIFSQFTQFYLYFCHFWQIFFVDLCLSLFILIFFLFSWCLFITVSFFF